MYQLDERSHHNVVGFIAQGVVTEQNIKDIIVIAESLIAQYDSLNFVYQWESFRYDSLKAMLLDFYFLYKYIKCYKRIVVVGDTWWKKAITLTHIPFVPVKYFDISELESAWDYVVGKSSS